MINGIINVYKEKGYTSHDVVAKLRGICKQKKIGHTGTLDPEAEGVLPVCLGNATRLCDMLTDKTKEYEAVFLLGVETDTQDMTGTVLRECPVTVSEEQVQEAIQSFQGAYEQIPPMYSALKVNGKKLYEYARAGKTVERKARPVFIHDITVTWIELPRIRVKVSCSKGTYIRTLAYDIGQKLGCGGTMETLLRTRVGEFLLEDSRKLHEIEKLQKAEQLYQIIVPVESVFSSCKKAIVSKENRKWIDNGNTLRREQLVQPESYKDMEEIRIYNDEGIFCGIYRYEEKEALLKPVKMFPGNEG